MADGKFFVSPIPNPTWADRSESMAVHEDLPPLEDLGSSLESEIVPSVIEVLPAPIEPLIQKEQSEITHLDHVMLADECEIASIQMVADLFPELLHLNVSVKPSPLVQKTTQGGAKSWTNVVKGNRELGSGAPLEYIEPTGGAVCITESEWKEGELL